MKISLLTTRVIFIALISFAFVANVQAQEALVSGTVTSQGDDSPLPGVNVLIKGTTVGTVTGVNGEYSLEVSPEHQTLVFSFIGYSSQEVSINGRTQIDISLAEDVQNLQEVVVVGYSTKKQSELSSSVTVVSGEKLRDVTSNNVESLLQGKAPGVIVSRPSGNPNEAPNVIIRGSSSITAGSAPLYVVDGIIGGTANPNDIESITVLKDAAATGLYGSRAANGVIIITTKSGESGKTRVDFSATTGINNPTMGNFDVMNSTDLLAYQRSFWDPALVDSERPMSLASQNTDWLDLAYRTGRTQNYVLSVSGGSDKTKVYISGNYFNEKGTIYHNGRDAYNIRTNVAHNLSDKLRLTVRVNADFVKSENEASGNYGALVLSARNMPWDNPYNPDGTIKMGTEAGWIGRENDNFLHGWQYNFDRSRGSSLNGDINLEYFITDNLTFSTHNRAGYDNGKRELYYDVRAKAGTGLGMLINDLDYGSSLITSNRLRFEKSYGSHNLSAIAVLEAEKNFYDENSLLGKGLPPGLHVINTASEILPSDDPADNDPGNTSENAFNKGLVQVDYSFNNKYFIVGSFIREASSRFGANNRAANFYTIGSSWVLSNESFMENQATFDMLKLRASYGSTGNAQIDNYQTLGLYSFSSQYAGSPASVPSQLANNNLTWEKAETVNLGLDIGLLKKVVLNIDLYDKTTDALLLNVQKPYSSGYTSVIENVGSVRNRGVEINLLTQNIDRAVKWETGFNIAFNNNTVIALDEGKDIIDDQRIIRVGEDMNSWYMRKWAGVDPANGDPLWELITTDANGQQEVSTTNKLSEATLQVVGTYTPDFTGGLQNTFSYKGFSLNTFFNFVSGNLVYNSSRESFDSDGAYETANNMVPAEGWSRWEKPGDIATHPRAVFGGNLNSNKPSSRFLEDGSYIRLRNIKLSYTLPQNFLSSVKIAHATVYVSGDNLWTATKFSGMDPEVSLGPDGGGAYYRYPISKRVLFGINLGF